MEDDEHGFGKVILSHTVSIAQLYYRVNSTNLNDLVELSSSLLRWSRAHGASSLLSRKSLTHSDGSLRV